MPNSSQTEQTPEPPPQKAPTVSPPAEKPKEVISEVQLYEYFLGHMFSFYIIKLVPNTFYNIFGAFCVWGILVRLLHRLAPSDRGLWRRER